MVDRRWWYLGEDVQDVKCELLRVESDFESDGFADTPVHATCLVRQGEGVVIWFVLYRGDALERHQRE